MKVFILCSNYEPGGAQRAAILLTSELKAKGKNVTLMFFHPKGNQFSKEAPFLISDVKINSIGKFLSFWRGLYRLLNKERPDVVLTFLPFANIIGQYCAMINGVKVRVASHRNESKKEMGLILRILDFLCANAGVYTKVTAVSASTKRSFSYYGKKVFSRIMVINNGLNYLPSNLSQGDCKKKFDIPTDFFVIGNIGRLVEQKNQQLLIKLLPELQGVHLVIVGKGALEVSLQNLAESLLVSDRVQFISELSTQDVPLFHKAIDVFVMPSLFEGLSNALIEALAAGLPIISSDVDSQRDVLIRERDGFEAGILVSNVDQNAWKTAILRLRDDAGFRLKLSEKAKLRSLDFSLEKMTLGFIQSFR